MSIRKIFWEYIFAFQFGGYILLRDLHAIRLSQQPHGILFWLTKNSFSVYTSHTETFAMIHLTTCNFGITHCFVSIKSTCHKRLNSWWLDVHVRDLLSGFLLRITVLTVSLNSPYFRPTFMKIEVDNDQELIQSDLKTSLQIY